MYRSWISGVTSLEVMLAHVVAQFVVMVVQVTFVLVFMLLVFQVSVLCLETFTELIQYSCAVTLCFAICKFFIRVCIIQSICYISGPSSRPDSLGSDSHNTPGQYLPRQN